MARSPSDGARITFPVEMKFQKSWRIYQAKLLEHLGTFMTDGRLHVIAAPGSGKTVFGLEVIRRMNQRTLILTPTVTIRNQWLERLSTHFLPPGSAAPDWISADIHAPEFLTVATYQALHAICSGEQSSTHDDSHDEHEDAINTDELNVPSTAQERHFKTIHFPDTLHDFKTLVVDEAHHLHAEWWRTLMFVAEKLNSPSIVALTATPPYDVSPYEWERYEELCGPIDAEVSVPELVRHGDLCAHQDYVYFSTPTEHELESRSSFRIAVDAFVQRLRANQDLTGALLAHPWIQRPEYCVEQILDDPQYLSSMVVYLHSLGTMIPKNVLNVLGIADKRIPGYELKWLEVLLSHCLFSDAESYAGIEPLLKAMRRDLRELCAIENRRVVLQDPVDQAKLLTKSLTKLRSIEDIVRLEVGSLCERFRCVILTDFIRKSALPHHGEETGTYDDIGVVPIFDTLRRARLTGVRLGVLSGSLIIVPTASRESVTQCAKALGIEIMKLRFASTTFDENYMTLELIGEDHQDRVSLLTKAFEQGSINVLVGTKSLLGEGWDAPAINTLVLASYVGSYMLSNQMRGRSIRMDANVPDKTANIWHLVCLEPGPFGPGPDYDLLVRRCSAFVGVHATASTIENGVERLGLSNPPYSTEEIKLMNEQTCRRALDRAALRMRWKAVLETGTIKEMTDGLRVQAQTLPGGFILTNTIASLFIQAVTTAAFCIAEFIRPLDRIRSMETLEGYLAFAIGATALLSLPNAVLAVWRYVRHSTPERSIREIGEAILESLEYAGALETASHEFRVYADTNEDGRVFCWLDGGMGRDQTVFLRTLREALKPIENPRYLLARKKYWRFFREDYFAVPEILAHKKEIAEQFAEAWRKRVGPIDLIYARTPDGRKLLLRARMHSLSAAFQKSAERVSCWK